MFLSTEECLQNQEFSLSSDLKKVIHAFISSQWDYCISLYSRLSQKTITFS